MSSKKDEVKESTNQFRESTDRYLDQQRQQVKDTTSNVSQTTQKINENVNKFQDDNRRILENNADTLRKYQGQINNTTQEISKNTIEFQKNVFNTYQSSYLQFLDNIYKSWENKSPERYSETYNTFTKNIQDWAVNTTNFINEMTVSGIENLNKTIELTQRYYNEIVQNNFNFARKTERAYKR